MNADDRFGRCFLGMIGLLGLGACGEQSSPSVPPVPVVQVAKAMAATGAAVLADPALMAAAKADFARRVAADGGYVSPIPDEVQPPLTMSLG